MPVAIGVSRTVEFVVTDDNKLAVQTKIHGLEQKQIVIGELTDDQIEHCIYALRQLRMFT